MSLVLANQADYESTLAAATSAPANACLFRVPLELAGSNPGAICAIYQTGASGAGGLVFNQSNDLGETWEGETQISSTTDVYAAGVINPDTGDIHLVYSRQGLAPGMDAGSSVRYRVLAWTGSTWTVGAESTVNTTAASASYACTNVTLAADSNGRLLALWGARDAAPSFYRVDGSRSTSPWDLTSFSAFAPWASPGLTSEVRVTVRASDSALAAVVEQGGTFRLYTTSLASVSPTLKQTWFATSTHQFDLCWGPTLAGFGSGAFGIVQNNGGKIDYRTYDPLSDTLSSLTAIAGSAPECYGPSIMRDDTEFIIGFTQEDDITPDTRVLRFVRTDDLGTIVDSATDAGSDGWDWTKMPLSAQDFDDLVVLWCDTLNTPYGVHLGQASIDIYKSSEDDGVGTESVVNGPAVDTTDTGTETIVAGEAKDVAETGAGAQVIAMTPQVLTTAAGLEALAQIIAPASPETPTGVETTITVRPTLNSDTGAAVEALVAAVVKEAADTGDVEEAPVVSPRLTGETGVVDEDPAVGIPVAETGAGADVFARLIPVAETGSIAETFDDYGIGQTIEVSDAGLIRETFGGTNGGSGRQRYDQLGATRDNHVYMHPGPDSSIGWERRGLVEGLEFARLWGFGDIDEDYDGIVFATYQTGGTTGWGRLLRSADNGRTFRTVGPALMASAVAHAPDGTLYCTGNNGSTPPSATGNGCPNPDGFLGYRTVCRQLFKSTDKGLSWTVVFDDEFPGSFCRYAHYTQIAVDPEDSSRVMASGLRRGAVSGTEVGIAYSDDAADSWVSYSPSIRAKPAVARGNQYAGDTILLGVGSGRFIFGGMDGGILVGPLKLWYTEDNGQTWTTTYSFSHGGGVAWTDCTYRDGKAYFVKGRDGDGDPDADEFILVSDDDCDTLDPVTPPEDGGQYTAVAYDYRLGTLYIGTQVAGQALWRMDDPTGGDWENATSDLSSVASDPVISMRGLVILNSISAIVEISLTDVGSGVVSSLPVTVQVSTTGTGTDSADFEFQVMDTGDIEELATLLKRTAMTVRLFMNRGRVIIRLEGSTESAVIQNPES